jgi:GAF domain-containing protein
LYEASTAIANAADADGILQELMTRAVSDASAAQILTYGPRDENGQYAYLQVAASWAADSDLARLPNGARILPNQLPPVEPLATAPFFIRDAADPAVSPDQQRILQGMHMRALLAYALVSGTEPMGLLIMVYREPHQFALLETQPLQALAGQVAVALRNQQLVREQAEARQQLDEINRRLTGQVWEQYARMRGQAMRQADVGPGVLQDALPSELAAPVMIHGQEIGQLRVEDATPDREWTPSEKALVQAVAGEVAIAIENARLIEQTERRAQREARLNQIAQQLRQTTDIHTILQTATEQLSLALDTSHAQARLGKPPAAAPRGNGQRNGSEEDQS